MLNFWVPRYPVNHTGSLILLISNNFLIKINPKYFMQFVLFVIKKCILFQFIRAINAPNIILRKIVLSMFDPEEPVRVNTSYRFQWSSIQLQQNHIKIILHINLTLIHFYSLFFYKFIHNFLKICISYSSFYSYILLFTRVD